MGSLADIKKAVHENTLRTRSVEAIIQSARFERIWEESDETQRQQAELAVWQGSKPKLIAWMRNHPSLELGERPMTYLKQRAKKLRVKNYSRLSKPELIRAIEMKENVNE